MHMLSWTALIRRIRTILTEHDTPPVELLIGTYTLAWGLFVLSHVDTFGSATAYQPLLRIAPEGVWGAGIAALGMVQLAAVLGQRQRCRIYSMLAGAGLWLWLAIATGLGSEFRSAGFVHFTLIAFWSGWSYWRIPRPRRRRCTK